MKNINYIAIRESQQLKNVRKQDKKALKEGWLLHGNLIVNGDLLYQSMTLREIANNFSCTYT